MGGACENGRVRCGLFGWSTPGSRSGEDSCVVVSQKEGWPNRLISALVLVHSRQTSLLADNIHLGREYVERYEIYAYFLEQNGFITALTSA